MESTTASAALQQTTPITAASAEDPSTAVSVIESVGDPVHEYFSSLYSEPPVDSPIFLENWNWENVCPFIDAARTELAWNPKWSVLMNIDKDMLREWAQEERRFGRNIFKMSHQKQLDLFIAHVQRVHPSYDLNHYAKYRYPTIGREGWSDKFNDFEESWARDRNEFTAGPELSWLLLDTIAKPGRKVEVMNMLNRFRALIDPCAAETLDVLPYSTFREWLGTFFRVVDLQTSTAGLVSDTRSAPAWGDRSVRRKSDDEVALHSSDIYAENPFLIRSNAADVSAFIRHMKRMVTQKPSTDVLSRMSSHWQHRWKAHETRCGVDVTTLSPAEQIERFAKFATRSHSSGRASGPIYEFPVYGVLGWSESLSNYLVHWLQLHKAVGTADAALSTQLLEKIAKPGKTHNVMTALDEFRGTLEPSFAGTMSGGPFKDFLHWLKTYFRVADLVTVCAPLVADLPRTGGWRKGNLQLHQAVAQEGESGETTSSESSDSSAAPSETVVSGVKRKR